MAFQCWLPKISFITDLMISQSCSCVDTSTHLEPCCSLPLHSSLYQGGVLDKTTVSPVLASPKSSLVLSDPLIMVSAAVCSTMACVGMLRLSGLIMLNGSTVLLLLLLLLLLWLLLLARMCPNIYTRQSGVI